MPSFSPRAAPSGAAPHRPMPRWPPMRPQRKRRGVAGSARGKGGMRRPPRRPVVFRVVLRTAPAPPSRKRTGESIAALAGKAGSAAGCRREARSFVEARCAARPGGRERGIPKGPPLGAGPGRREPRVSGRARTDPRGSGVRHADFVYAGVNNRSMQRRFGASGPHGGAVAGKLGAIGVLKLDTAMSRRRARTKDVSGARW